MRYTAFLTHILQEASWIAKKYFGTVSGTVKPDDPNQVLTEADLAIGKYIIQEIQKTYPDHTIIDEEAGGIDRHSAYTWVVDPIDGTSNFAVGVPTYGVIVGLLENAKPIAGGVALPAYEKIIIAEHGKGAYANGKQISVTRESSLGNVLVAYAIDGHPEDPKQTERDVAMLGNIALHCRNIRTSNSVFDAMMVSEGKYGAWLAQTSKIWDNVGTQVILEEAGALYTDFWGKPMDYTEPLTKIETTYTICVAPNVLHTQLQNMIMKTNHSHG